MRVFQERDRISTGTHKTPNIVPKVTFPLPQPPLTKLLSVVYVVSLLSDLNNTGSKETLTAIFWMRR